MKTKKTIVLILFFGLILKPDMAFGWVDSTLFSPKLFIENKGQFDKAPYLKDFPKVLFAMNHIHEKIFFSENKIAYTLHQNERDEKAFREFREEESKKHSSGLENEEELKYEEELKSKVFKSHTAVVNMEWLGSNANCKIIAEDVAKEYFNYGMDKDIRHDINFVHGYKKIIYKNLYNGVDVEYSFHPEKGIKYNIIVNPGADISKIKLKYSGGQSVSLDRGNNIVIKTSIGNIIDHAPVSYYESGEKIKSSFVLNGNTISFKLNPSTINHQPSTIIIDPWVSSTLPTLDTAYEVAVDPSGNVWVYGDFESQVKKYDNTGAPLWTFLSGPGYLYNATLIGGDLTVDPTGNSYVSGSECVRKLSPAGTSLWLYAPVRNITNISCCELGWRMVFDPATNRLYGVGSNAQTKATWYDPATGNPMWLPNGSNACNIISGPCPSACPNANGEFRHITRAPNGNFYGYTAVGDGSTSNNVSTITGFDPNFTSIYRSCNVPPSPYWTIPFNPSSPTYYVGCYYMGNGIAASNCYIYIYTGDQVQKFDIYAPTFLGSTNIANGTLVMNSGILADLMNNFYVGTQTGISAYDPNFNLITSVATSKPVYDMAFAPGNNIAACGIGFVGVFSNIVQTGSPITCNPSPNLPMSATADSLPGTGCSSNNAMAWVDTIINGTGPYTYSWSTGATTDTIINLAPGTYSCTIIDASCPAETTTVFITIPASSGFTVIPTSTANLCFGGTNGSASVNITGGSSPYTYLWSPFGGNSSAATGLSAGNYTITITDASGCTGTQTVSVSQPTALSATVSSTAESCGGSNGTATVAASGGTGSYTYYWNPIAQITQTASNLPAGNYAVTVTDANGCTINNTVTVAATGSLTANASNGTICAGQNASLTASGGTNYSWSNGNTTSSINVFPTVTTTYSVIVSSGTCSDTTSATVVVYSSPNISAWSNTTIAAGSSTTLSASGGNSYSWSNGQTATVITVSPSITTMYCVSSSNGTCTDTACVTVSIEPPDDCSYADDQLFVPDAFSPNGDSKNDVFGVYYPNISCIKEFMFIIYDRWGEKIFEADNMSVLWDGTYNGKPMNTAVFVYYMKVTFITENETIKKGNISLIR